MQIICQPFVLSPKNFIALFHLYTERKCHGMLDIKFSSFKLTLYVSTHKNISCMNNNNKATYTFYAT